MTEAEVQLYYKHLHYMLGCVHETETYFNIYWIDVYC